METLFDENHENHECITYLGQHNNYDLYHSTQGGFLIPTVIARYGNEPYEYKSGLCFADTDEELAKAKALAISLNLPVDMQD